MVVQAGHGPYTVVVTGGSGLVGRAIHSHVTESSDSEHLLSHYTFHFLSSSDCDLSKTGPGDSSPVYRTFKQLRPQCVLHLAAYVGGLFRNLNANYDFFQKNVTINTNVIDTCVRLNITRLVACASTCVFPDGCEIPITEQMMHDGEPHHSNYGYAYAKRMLDIQCRAARQQFGFDYFCVIPTNIFGPHDNFNEAAGHVIPGLINRCHRTMQENGQEFTVWGSGKPLRQFIFSLDLAKIIVWSIDGYKSSEPLILCGDEKDELSIAELAHKIALALGFQGKVVFDDSKADGQFRKTASNRRLREVLPDFEFTPLEDSIKITCQWFVNNIASARLC